MLFKMEDAEQIAAREGFFALREEAGDGG